MTTIGSIATAISFRFAGRERRNAVPISFVLPKAALPISPVEPALLPRKPSIRTERIGPIEQRATRPKLSASARLSLRTFETPTPSARMKGTVMGPVVTPPESKAMHR
ncbi:unknown [Candidatus Colimorpha enterica]|uniref:Uncharacterized protein n=1 Tax=Candidatus Colimorpha enterica TaxID=3083063 RepID=R6U628_9BACT|nr:unknown [Candidatus Colimorpha enterica]